MRRRISTSAETLVEYLTSAFSREKIKGEIDNKDSTFLFLFVRDELGVRLAGCMGAEQQTDYLAGTRCTTPRKAAAIIDVFLLLQALDFAADGHRGQRRKAADKSPYSNHIITVADLVAPQIEHAPRGSTRAKPIQLADKIANARDIIERLPVGWSRERREEYPKWSADIVAGCWRTKPSLEQLFDEVLERGRSLLAERETRWCVSAEKGAWVSAQSPPSSSFSRVALTDCKSN